MPLVSIVIPCYNHARYLDAAIGSALAQTHASVEVIVVDDGSTDDSAAVAERHAGVRLVRQRNRGLGAARNTGLRESRGAFLTFLDADDRLLPGAIAAGLHALAADDAAAFAFGRYRVVDDAGRVLDVPVTPPVADDPYEAMLRQSFISMHATVLFRRAAVEAIGGYDESLDACEDFELYLRLTRRFPVRQHAAIVADYRHHESNKSRDKRRIIEAALTVLGREWPHVRADPVRRAAFEAGMHFWVTSYANDTVWPAAAGAWRRGGPGARRGARTLLGAAPQWLLARARERWRRRARGVLDKLMVVIRRRPSVPYLGHSRPEVIARATEPRLLSLPVGFVRLGDLRHVQPIDRHFGFSRGWPIDRHYIDAFLAAHANDIRGRVLEIKDSSYTHRLGGQRVIQADVLDIDADNPLATYVADLTDGAGVPDDAFDCVVLTQTLHIIYDVRAALRTVHRVLKPGGVVLATVPGITKVDSGSPWFWSFTPASARRMFEEVFPAASVEVRDFGNVLAAIGFLEGLAESELLPEELDAHDREYPVCIAIRAVKPGGERDGA
jgi:SAM-dependent methyltransferase